MKKIVSFVIFFILYSLFANYSFAASSNFATDYDVTYNVMPNGNTHVDFNVVLTNKSSQYYVSSYSIKVGFKTLDNLKASDPDGSIIPTVVQENEEKNIGIIFNKKVVGIDNKLNFSLSFDTPNIVDRFGKIWEINIPGLARQDFQTFNVHVTVPNFLGNPSYIKPQIDGIINNNLNFNKDQLGKSGVSIAFGDSQIYKFSLKYHLSNPNLFPVKTAIAIPPSTNYQEVQIDSINPKPLNVSEDNDGNWLATYTLMPSVKKEIIVEGKVKVSLIPKKESLSKEQLDNFLKEQPYWQTSNEKIKKLAQDLKTPAAIYEYVVRNLQYDFSRVTENKGRLGAVSVLAGKDSAVCLEFTDLFVALARAAGIPAREIDGFAYAQNSKERPLSLLNDILHAWPEYYDFDRQTWIMVDPTWGNTTHGIDYFHVLDFDHFAFVIKGGSSVYPIPAGGYKLAENKDSKDVNVGFSDNFDTSIPAISLKENFSKDFPSSLPISGEIVIRNVSKGIVYPQELVVTADKLSPILQKINIGKIPPFGFKTIPISFYKTPILTNRKDMIKIAIGNNTSSWEIKIYPFFFNKLTLAGGTIFVIFIVVLSFIAIKSRGIPFFKQKR